MTPRAASRACVALALFVLGCGETVGAPVLRFDTEPLCEGDPVTCINANTETIDIAGLRVIHKQIPGHPMVAMRISFEADESRGGTQLWAESIALSLLEYGGSARFSRPAWQAELLQLSSYVGTWDDTDFSGIYGLAPRPNWRAVWDLLAEATADPRIFAYELENRRGIFANNLATARDDPNDAANIEAWSKLFAGEPYNGHRESESALGAVGAADVAVAWSRLMTKRRMLIVVVGDVGRDELTSAVGEAFGHLPDVFVAGSTDIRTPGTPTPEASVLSYPDSPTWHVRSYFRGPPAGSPDMPALAIGLSVLGQRLFNEVRDVRGLAYSTGASMSLTRQTYGSFWLTSESPNDALPVARQLLVDLKATGPTEVELSAALSGLRTSLISSSLTPYNLSWSLGYWQLVLGDRLAVEDYVGAAEALTPAQIAATLAAYVRDVATAAAGGGSVIDPAQLNALFVSP